MVIHVNRIHDYGQLLQQFGISNAVEVETQITVSCMSVEEQRTKQISEIIGHDSGIIRSGIHPSESEPPVRV